MSDKQQDNQSMAAGIRSVCPSMEGARSQRKRVRSRLGKHAISSVFQHGVRFLSFNVLMEVKKLLNTLFLIVL
jgi:hypothetical protein